MSPGCWERESLDRHTVFVDRWLVCVWDSLEREGWRFGLGDCKSLWPALASSGWQRFLNPRHSSTCPSRPPRRSHIVRSLALSFIPPSSLLICSLLFTHTFWTLIMFSISLKSQFCVSEASVSLFLTRAVRGPAGDRLGSVKIISPLTPGSVTRVLAQPQNMWRTGIPQEAGDTFLRPHSVSVRRTRVWTAAVHTRHWRAHTFIEHLLVQFLAPILVFPCLNIHGRVWKYGAD